MPDPSSQTRSLALRLLGRRALSEAELRTKLAQRGHSEPAIDDALAMARSYGFVNDAELADAVVRESGRKARGPQWVRRTLLHRGVTEELANSAAAASQDGATARARALVERRFGDAARLDPRQRQRAGRLLASRGFHPDSVREVLDNNLT